MAASVCDLNMYTNVDARDCTQELCKHRWRVCAESQLWAKRSLAATDGVWTSIHSYCHWLLRPMLYQLSHILPLDNRHFDYLLLSATPNSESRPPLQPFISSTPCVDGHSDARGTDQNCLGEEGAVYRELCCRNGTSRASKLCEKDAIKSNISSCLSTIGSITPGLRQNSLVRKIDVAMMKKKTRTKKMQHWLADCWISRPAPLRSVPMTFSGVGSGRSSLRVRIALMVRSMLPDISWSQSCTGKQRKVVLRVNSVVHTPYTHITITNNPPPPIHTQSQANTPSYPPRKTHTNTKPQIPTPWKENHTHQNPTTTHDIHKNDPTPTYMYTHDMHKNDRVHTHRPPPLPPHTHTGQHTHSPPPPTHTPRHTQRPPPKTNKHTAPPPPHTHTHRPIHTHTHTMSQLLKLQVPGPYTALRWSPHCAALPPPWSRRRTGAAWSLLRTSPSLARTLICPGSWPRWNETLKRQRKPHVAWKKRRKKKKKEEWICPVSWQQWNETLKRQRNPHMTWKKEQKNKKQKTHPKRITIPIQHSLLTLSRLARLTGVKNQRLAYCHSLHTCNMTVMADWCQKPVTCLLTVTLSTHAPCHGWLVSKTSNLLTVTLSTHAPWLSWLTGVKNLQLTYCHSLHTCTLTVMVDWC